MRPFSPVPPTSLLAAGLRREFALPALLAGEELPDDQLPPLRPVPAREGLGRSPRPGGLLVLGSGNWFAPMLPRA